MTTPPAVAAGQPAEEAIPRLLEAYGPGLYWMAVRLCGDPTDAEDLVQETFLQAFRKWHQFQGRSHPRTWLYTIATRACGRMHRRRAGEPARMASLSELLPFGATDAADLAAADQLTEQERAERTQRVQAAIASLPMTFRMPLVLKEVAGLSLADIASVLGLKTATVKTRIHRGRLRIRQAVEEGLPRRPVPPPAYSKQVCLDLLQAKQEALDRGVPFPGRREVLCEQCRALFAALDLAHDMCRRIAEGDLPEPVRRAILGRVGTSDDSRAGAAR
ncbi:MAG: RNA polymerase sigma factor [Planctomycetota bacterium]|jgi:RNA polymerase sigma-70 factor (ECF subfamily)